MTVRGGRNLPKPTPIFIADHPFIFYLAEKSNTVLFTGKVSKPQFK